jgi:endonuclease G
LNIDQTQIKSVRRTNNWRIDTRIGAEFQLNNDYYRSNPWDRGHLARRATAAWGENGRQAKHASDDTFFYSNASLQHANFNQDEWLALEEWVKDLGIDDTNKLNSISGPIWGEHPRSITPQGRDTALIPTAFFKVISFIKDGELEVRAYMMAQDAAALADKRGKRMFDNQRYQVSVTEIEELTGLIFPAIIPDTNPLFFNETDASRNLGVISTPEHIEVDTAAEVVGANQQREPVLDEMIDVFIMAAMVNPKGSERDGEWITILNLSEEEVSLKDWHIRDKRGARCDLPDKTIDAGEAVRITPVAPVM